MKEDKVHPNLIVLVLFLLRILLLRLNPETLNTVFRPMWPSILFLLIKIIGSKTNTSEVSIAALKLLEVISCLDIEEFHMHKWIFLFEYFGVMLEFENGKNQSSRPKFIIKPMLTKLLSKNINILYTGENLSDLYPGKQRRIIIKENKLPDDGLEAKIFEFLTYIILLSTGEAHLDRDELENIIKSDFVDFSNLGLI